MPSGGAGSLDRRVLLQRQVTARDSAGAVVETWSDVGRVWAEFTQKPGASEEFSVDQRSAPQRAVFRIRYRANLDPKRTRLVYRGRVWGVEGISDVGRRDYLDLECLSREVGTVEA